MKGMTMKNNRITDIKVRSLVKCLSESLKVEVCVEDGELMGLYTVFGFTSINNIRYKKELIIEPYKYDLSTDTVIEYEVKVLYREYGYLQSRNDKEIYWETMSIDSMRKTVRELIFQ